MIATKPDPAMRGQDYRSKTVGIQLFVMQSFHYRREAIQAIYRVGRNGDPKKLVKLQGLNLIDPDNDLIYKS